MESITSINDASSMSAAEQTRRLMTCGVIAGLMFAIVSFIQAFSRTGFDIRCDAISLLCLGDKGWIQTANFILSGVLATAFALGIRKALSGSRAGEWWPIFVAAFGTTLITAGIFRADPSFDFPPGAPSGMPTTTWHNMLHGFSFMAVVVVIISAWPVAIALRLRKEVNDEAQT